MNFLVNGNDSSELDLPELQDDSDFANLAKYVRRNDQNRDDRRPDRLFGAIATAAPVSISAFSCDFVIFLCAHNLIFSVLSDGIFVCRPISMFG